MSTLSQTKYDDQLLKELGLTEEEFEAIQKVVELCDEEEKEERDKLLQEWKLLELNFRGFFNLAWDEKSKNWVSPTGKFRGTGTSQAFSEKIINIYRGYGESIIAALSASVPKVRFFPDDADNPLDVTTAKMYSRVQDKIEIDNSMSLKVVYALLILFNQGLVFAHNHYEEDETYGTVKKPIFKTVNSTTTNYACPDCGFDLKDDSIQICESCGEKVIPEPYEGEETSEIEEDYEEIPKGKECIDIYGPLNVKIPINVKRLVDTPYLRLEVDQHKARMYSLFPHIKNRIERADDRSSDRWSRQTRPSATSSDSEVTYKRYWIRHEMFELLPDTSKIESLLERHPKGLLIHYVEDQLALVEEENLDDQWTGTESPLAHNMHADPVGKVLKPIQDIENDLVALAVKTVKHGIPETWADPRVIDFDAYRSTPADAGMLYPIKGQIGPNQKLDNFFYRNQPATLSKEVGELQGYLNERAQFVLGAYPAIYGGVQKGGSDTFSQYEMSRNQSLQRLGTIWKIINIWYPRFSKKAVVEFKNNMQVDTNFVQEHGGSFKNVWIKLSEMSGEVGDVISESFEQFPVTWPQLRALTLELMGLNKPYIDSALTHPSNIGFVQKTLGFGGLHIPGQQDRDKQIREIKQLIESVPVPDAPNLMEPELQPKMLPSVQIDPDIDNHAVHMTTIQDWATSEEGLGIKETNPEAYENVLLHFRQHKDILTQQQPPMQGPPPEEPGTMGDVESLDQPADDKVGIS